MPPPGAGGAWRRCTMTAAGRRETASATVAARASATGVGDSSRSEDPRKMLARLAWAPDEVALDRDEGIAAAAAVQRVVCHPADARTRGGGGEAETIGTVSGPPHPSSITTFKVDTCKRGMGCSACRAYTEGLRCCDICPRLPRGGPSLLCSVQTDAC